MVHLGCMRQQPFELPANVAFGSKTEVSRLVRHVRLTLRSRHRQPAAACPFGALVGCGEERFFAVVPRLVV
jgi:aminoglycoside phosphotransferase